VVRLVLVVQVVLEVQMALGHRVLLVLLAPMVLIVLARLALRLDQLGRARLGVLVVRVVLGCLEEHQFLVFLVCQLHLGRLGCLVVLEVLEVPGDMVYMEAVLPARTGQSGAFRGCLGLLERLAFLVDRAFRWRLEVLAGLGDSSRRMKVLG
jgi:hypothetical protein